MAKSFDGLYSQITDFANLYEAWQKAAKGKRRSYKCRPHISIIPQILHGTPYDMT